MSDQFPFHENRPHGFRRRRSLWKKYTTFRHVSFRLPVNS
jgi:hypothetical protein